MSPTLHMIVGSIVLLLFLANAVMYGIEMTKGRPLPKHRLVSIGAATALLLQYGLGFMLMGANGMSAVKWYHWVIALIAILPVGWEHMATSNQPKFRTKSMVGLIATAITFALVLVAYGIGEMAK